MNTKYLVLFLSAVFFVVSCDKVVEKEVPAPQEESTEVIIHASLVGNGDTKTVLQENGAVYWQPGDQIAVFFNSVKVPFTSYNSVNAASAYFVGNMDITVAHNENSDGTLAGEYVFWGLYPLYSLPDYYGRGFYYRFNRISYCDNVYDDMYTEDYYGRISYLLSAGDCNGKIVSTVSHYWQKAVAGTFDAPLNIALAKSEEYHELSFYNVLGGVRFSVQSPDITRVTFKGNNQEVLAGEFSVQMDTDGKPVITEVSDPFEMVTLTLEDGGTFTPGEWYYIMLFPTVLSKGYTMELYKDNIKAKKVVTSSVEVKRSVFGSLANVEADLVFDTEVVYCDEINIEGERYVSIGGETQFIAHPQPENCTFPRVWRSENPSIATVDENGIVKGVSQGETYINCFVDYEYEGKWIRVLGENECGSLTIQTPDGNDIDYYDAQYIGEQVQLTAVPSPSSFTGTVVWSSNDESIAMVDQTGLVTITGDGVCYITAQAGDATDQVWIYARNLEIPGEYDYDYSVIRLNEVFGAGEAEEKFIELYNVGDEPISLKNVYILKDESTTWTGIEGEIIPAKGVWGIIGGKGTTERGFSSGLSTNKSVLLELYAPDGTKLDSFQRGEPDETGQWGTSITNLDSGSWSRIPDGTGSWMITSTPTPNSLNGSQGTEDPLVKP